MNFLTEHKISSYWTNITLTLLYM